MEQREKQLLDVVYVYHPLYDTRVKYDTKVCIISYIIKATKHCPSVLCMHSTGWPSMIQTLRNMLEVREYSRIIHNTIGRPAACIEKTDIGNVLTIHNDRFSDGSIPNMVFVHTILYVTSKVQAPFVYYPRWCLYLITGLNFYMLKGEQSKTFCFLLRIRSTKEKKSV